MVEYDEEDPTDYTAWGFWMDLALSPSGITSLEFGSIATGPDFEEAARYVSNLTGTATYQGDFSGAFLHVYPESVGVESAEYFASVDLTANFDSDTIAGCLGCREATLYDYEEYLDGVGRVQGPEKLETDLRILLGEALITSDGKFQSRNVTV